MKLDQEALSALNTVTAMSLVPAKKSDIKSLLKLVIRTPLIKSNAVW